MGKLPEGTVRAYIAQPSELPAALSEARGCGLTPAWDENNLVLHVPLLGPPSPSAGEPPLNIGDITAKMWTEEYLLEGVFDDYRALPPIWRFLDPRTRDDIGPAAYPAPRGPSVLHPHGLVCAHFSRNAYAEHGGPHGNWNGPSAWQTPVEGTQALTISAMLARLTWEVRYNSVGRMAELPPCAAAA